MEELASPLGLPEDRPTLGQRTAEAVAKVVGSWRFIAAQSLAIALWVIFNQMRQSPHWDPYPFILMNLVLSMQAAYTAPMIMMAQNREARRDRYLAQTSYVEITHTESDVLRLHELMLDQNNKLDELNRKIEQLQK